MDYTLLEDAYPEGGDFKARTTVKEGKEEVRSEPKRHTSGAAMKAVTDLTSVLPLDTNAETSNFTPTPRAATQQAQPSTTAHESFTIGGDDMKIKMDKILQMVEQNKTGYEPNSHHDMFLYVLTGVMFLFTFDTFVMLGKSMRV
jgi:hypothetical protein